MEEYIMTCNKFTQDNNLIKEIPLPDLIVNYAYQRKPDSRMVDFIKNKKDFCLSAPLIVAHRDNNYYVIDGVKTIVSFKNRMSGDTLINCFVARNNSIADEIQLLEALHCRR
jgi:hypothetical protein